MKKLRIAVALLLAAMICCVAGFAHPGRTDANGGHWNRSTGTYHYHHGYPEHQHTNGICPYDFDDQTGANSGTSGSSKNPVVRAILGTLPQKKKELFDSQHPAITSKQQDASTDGGNSEVWTFLFALGVPVLIVGTSVLEAVHENRRAAASRQKEEVRRAAIAEQMRLERQDQEERLQAERDSFLLAYDGNSLNEVIPPPDGCYLGADGLPHGPGRGKWGEYTMYITAKGKVFHSQSVCGTACGRPINLANVSGRRPCSRCCKQLPNLGWYDAQRKLFDESVYLFGYSIFRTDAPNTDE